MDDLEEELSIFQKVRQPLINLLQKNPLLLREAQKFGLDFIIDWFNDEYLTNEHCAVVLPTGCGKSGICVLAPYLLGSKRTMVVVPSLELKTQMMKDFFGYTAANANVKAHYKAFLVEKKFITNEDLSYQTKYLPRVALIEDKLDLNVSLLQKDLVIVNAHKFSQRNESSANHWMKTLPIKDIDFIIIDEAHHFPSTFWNSIVEVAKSNKKKILFLTATPYRASDSKEVIDMLKGNIPDSAFARKWGGKRYYHVSIASAIEKNWIRRTEKHSVDSKSNEDLLLQTVNLMNQKDINNQLPDGKMHRALILASDINDANNLLEICRNNILLVGLNATIYHSANPNKSLAKLQFEKHVRGQVRRRALIVVDMLREGYDFPPVSVVVICCNVGSSVKAYQFIGRGFRTMRERDPVCDILYLKNPKLEKLIDEVLEEKFIPNNEVNIDKNNTRIEDVKTVPSKKLGFGDIVLPPNHKLLDCGGDGDCLFRVAAFLLLGNVDQHVELRQRVCDQIATGDIGVDMQDYLYGEDLQARVRAMRVQGTYADDYEVQAIAFLYPLHRIEIYQAGTPVVIKNEGAMNVIKIAYNPEHYQAIVPN